MIPQSGIFKLAITSVIFVFGIVAYPLIICLFPKTLWFFFLSSLGIWIQFYHSITNKIFPYAKFIVLYYLNILFLGGLATVYPCGNFIELSPMDFLILFLYSAISYVTISFYLQKKIQVEAGMKVAEESNFNQR